MAFLRRLSSLFHPSNNPNEVFLSQMRENSKINPMSVSSNPQREDERIQRERNREVEPRWR